MIQKDKLLLLVFLFIFSASFAKAIGLEENNSSFSANNSVENDSTKLLRGEYPLTVESDSTLGEHHFPHKITKYGTGVAETVVSKVFKPDVKLNADSIIKVFDDSPSFGIYKDNYIVIGADLLRHPDEDDSDAKFQISVIQRLTNSVLPFRTYLFLTYTQIAFWDVFKESFPFRDINFNPTIGLAKPLVNGNRYLGEVSLQFEHESNGKDDVDSRSWNRISFHGLFNINSHWTYFSKLWIPFVDGENNRDLVRYKGYGIMAINYNQRNKFGLSFIANLRPGGIGNMNMTLNASYRLFKNDNQYLFFELYNGYGEGLLDYKEFHQRFRLGFAIRPTFRFIN